MRARCALLLIALVALTLTGCDPHFVSREEDRASVDVNLTMDGGTFVQLELGGPPSRDRLLEVGEAVAPALLPTAEHRRVRVSENGPLEQGNDPYVEIDAANTYQLGTHSTVSIDTATAVSVLRRHGYRIIDVSIDVPDMPTEAEWNPAPDFGGGHGWAWNGILPGDPAPAGSVRLQPKPWTGMPSLGMFAISLACVVAATIAIRRRRRIVAAVGAGLSSIPLTAGYKLIDESDHLPTTDVLERTARAVAVVTPIAGVLIAGAAICVLCLALVGTRFDKAPLVFNPPPGWPTPPAGWRLHPGWQPNPAWPPPPDGWEFFVEQKSDP